MAGSATVSMSLPYASPIEYQQRPIRQDCPRGLELPKQPYVGHASYRTFRSSGGVTNKLVLAPMSLTYDTPEGEPNCAPIFTNDSHTDWGPFGGDRSKQHIVDLDRNRVVKVAQCTARSWTGLIRLPRHGFRRKFTTRSGRCSEHHQVVPSMSSRTSGI
jgi:hypothetical protein